jgi:hypothetical protein
MANSIRDGLQSALRAAVATLALTSLIAFGIGLLSAAIWTFDARSLPRYAIAWLCFFFVIGLVTGVPAFFLRKRIGRHRIHIVAAGAVGMLSGVGVLLGISYSNSCSALGWHYDQQADLMIPTVVWTDTLNCRNVGRYQQFAGVWTYGEWGQRFKPTGAQASLPLGNLLLDEAGMNMMFDNLLRQRPSRYAEKRIYIQFRGNMLVQGRHDAAHPYPLYWVRDISEARLVGE